MDDKKAEQETPVYVGYIRYAYATIFSIPRLQIYIILAFVCQSLAPAISTSFGGWGGLVFGSVSSLVSVSKNSEFLVKVY